MRKIISNTTPLISLPEIGCIDILQKLYGEIIIPDAVFGEILQEPSKTIIANSDFIKVCSVKDLSKGKIFSSRLHAGEKEVILLAEEIKADLLLIDDNAAKKTAKFLGFNISGTVGILLKAKEKGYISELKPLLNKLLDTGFYISEKIYNFALKNANEL